MSSVAFPTRPPRDYGGAVVTGVREFEGEQDEYVLSVAARLVAGEESALEEIYDRWSALVHTCALRALHDPHDAEDVTQQVFVAAWRSRHTLTPSPSALPSWLIGIARHKISDVRAARSRDVDRARAVAAVPDSDLTVEAADREIADRLVVRQAVQDLPDPRRTIVFLAFWEERSHAEIAETTGLPLGTVKSHVRRGLIHIHQQLEGVRR
ncbi:sigma-70 family RNA polymerase sigma factor [Nocardioides sp.]|uniref:RNA polymerase sigma factor n=1 Tax=Nocardioides sp. TaxID=35761 RepID=UPI0026057175|nr:sigma-70 family RNA polymerase sigma factor [Nocardioides sp.]MCW2736721.1 polymerase, sigma-24 subunit, subfamily [Nocardioides sp.]